MLGKGADWLEDRTAVRTAILHFLFERIPASSGWPQVFGSVALFLFLIQTFTGILLALNFAATPGDAYFSVSYIQAEVLGGRMVRGLHHWGASAMMVVVCIHMAQVFIYGAYKKPREATWIAGVLLFFFTTAFGLTGYLLPWDNKAYWGTMVTTRIAKGIPFAGDALTRLMGATDGVGVVTFSRFYALHTLILPAATVGLIAIHIYLIRLHGVAPTPSNNGKTQLFFPRQAFRDITVIFITFVCLFSAAALIDVPLERMADPTDATYVPRPEWYFLFLFQLLKVFPGRLELIGTVILPSLAVLLLFVLPFLPSTRRESSRPRLKGTLFVVIAFSIWAGLTATAVSQTPRRQGPANVVAGRGVSSELPPAAVAAWSEFRALQCTSCHNLVAGTPKPGPDLGLVSIRRTEEWLTRHIADRSHLPPNTGSTPADEQNRVNALFLLLNNPSPEAIQALRDLSPRYIEGAKLFVNKACGACHTVNGDGGTIGPVLNGLVNRRSAAWVRAHFASPRSLSPSSTMPEYHFSQPEEEVLLAYLFSL